MLNVSVLGLGLIGGSLLRALAMAGYQARGYDVDPDVRAAAKSAATDASRSWRIVGSIAEAAAGADLTVLAAPLPAVTDMLDELHAADYPRILTDVTSVKGPVDRLVRARMPRARHVGGHPMAGKERSGFAASDARLFDGCAWALCLESDTPLEDWLTVADLVTRIGARVAPCTATDHDIAVAAVSHLPHLTATALAAAADTGLARTLAAGSYRDGTRVAGSSPDLVAAMCGGNAPALGVALDQLLARLADARSLLGQHDPAGALREWLAVGHAARGRWPATASAAAEIPATAQELLQLARTGGWVTAVSTDRRTITAATPGEV